MRVNIIMLFWSASWKMFLISPYWFHWMIIFKVKIMSNRQCPKNIEIVPTMCVQNNFEKNIDFNLWLKQCRVHLFGFLKYLMSTKVRGTGTKEDTIHLNQNSVCGRYGKFKERSQKWQEVGNFLTDILSWYQKTRSSYQSYTLLSKQTQTQNSIILLCLYLRIPRPLSNNELMAKLPFC